MNCFRKAGISAENHDVAIVDEDDPFKDLQDEIDALRTVSNRILFQKISTQLR